MAIVAACAKAPAPAERAQSSPTPDVERQSVALTAPGDSSGGIIVEKNVMVSMRDGVRLATDVYRPAAPGQYPVVLMRTPYGSETKAFADKGKYYVDHGYAFVVQDVRGKYDSEGEWHGKRDEAQDGSDAITWAGTRSWSSGKVGMTGGSYLGMVQYWVADQENPHLGALTPFVGPATLGRDTSDFDHLTTYGGRESFGSNLVWMLFTDGRVNQSDGQGDLGNYTYQRARLHLPIADFPKVFGREMKWLPYVLNQRYGMWEEYYLRAAQGEWSKPISAAWWAGYKERYQKVKVPMLHISGWFDCCNEAPIKNFQQIRELATEPVAKNNQHLMLGPWYHGVGTRKVGELDFGPGALLNPDSITVRWLDRWLKGVDNGFDKEPPVKVFVMGANRWREATDWPIPGTRFTKYYLHSTGEARLAKGGGSLSVTEPEAEPADRYTYDPGNPTPEKLDSNRVWETGPANRVAIEQREDVLVYTTEALKQPVEVTGPLSAVLYVSTSAPSTDFLVRLIDVYPDGRAINVFGAFLNPYRTGWAREVEQGPEGLRIAKAEISLYPTGIEFQPGHRIRVEIASSAAPTVRGLNVEPGTEATATRWNVARQTIWHDKTHPSHILLPVIPR
jgi:putative CocE/NonD family hydrolase